MTPEERIALIETFRHVPDVLEDTLRPLSDAQLTLEALPGEWTVAQIVHHLADAHMNAFIRFKLILVEDYPTFKAYEQVDWAETPEALDASVQDSLLIIRGLHHRWARLMATLSEGQWERKGLHPHLKEITAEGLLTGYVRHSQNHLDQIAKTLIAAQAAGDQSLSASN
ncbi:MAG: DinB family protein [Chloroflexota bacterium]|nr:DinB family protein [Chloroflexota bacterium]